jgi:alkylation response protein AidB-like acyl-CoA dehydrogenase
MGFDLGLSDDQQSVADLFGAFFADKAPPDVVRAAEPLGFDRKVWEALVAMEAPGMGAPAEAGGGGAALSDLVVVAEAVGRAVAPVPLVDHLVASRAHPVADLVRGTAVGAVAVRPAAPDGTWRLVPAGAVADCIVGLDGDELVAVRSTPPGTGPANHASAPLADRHARTGERTVLGDGAAFGAVLDEWRILTAAALIGIGAAALDLALAYVLEREQFGRKIGAFQAIQHGLADFPAFVDGGRLLVHKAAWAADHDLHGQIDIDDNDITDLGALSRMAFVHAAEAAAVTTDRSLHYHGGYGFSREYDIQLYFRRARGWANVLGDPARQRQELADLLWPRGAEVSEARANRCAGRIPSGPLSEGR